MRFHVASLPHTQTTDDYSACAYTQKVVKFCTMMVDKGHEVYLYAGDHNTAPCTRWVPCIDEAIREQCLGGRHYVEGSFDATLPHWKAFNAAVIAAMRARVQEHDFICVIAGKSQKVIADAFPGHMTVEFGIGYSGTFSPYRVWESYAWMHACYGAAAGPAVDMDGKWFDAVIPNAFDVSQFPANRGPQRGKERYFLFLGRLVDRKGYQIAIETCERLGEHLVLAGPGEPPPGSDYRGVVGPAERADLLSHAQAVFVPTKYVEPFGGVAVEAMLCGTPVITTDWGAFTETVQHGMTGYRCRSYAEFCAAAKMAPKLERKAIRSYARLRYSLASVGRQYDTYFKRLNTLWGKGYYEGKPE